MTDNTTPLRRLFFFDAICREGGICQAANAIGVTQPAVSQAIKKLEKHYEVQLFKRGHGGCELTHEGSLLQLRVKRMFEQMEAAIMEAVDDARVSVDNIRAICRHLTDTQLRSHIAIARFGSGVAASRHLGISQVAVHHAARELESTVGVTLYRRQVHNVAVNPSGLNLAQKLSYALREVDQATSDLAFARGQAKGKIVVGILPLLPQRLLARAIWRLRQFWPNVIITIHEGSHSQLLDLLQFGEIDIVIGALHSQWQGNIIEYKLFDDPYIVVVRENHPLARKKNISLKDLVNYDWVVPQKNMPRRAIIETMMSSLPTPPQIAVETSSLAMMISMLEESDCISLLSQSHILYGKNLQGLVSLDVSTPEKNRTVGITTHANLLATPIQQAFIDCLRNTMVDVAH